MGKATAKAYHVAHVGAGEWSHVIGQGILIEQRRHADAEPQRVIPKPEHVFAPPIVDVNRLGRGAQRILDHLGREAEHVGIGPPAQLLFQKAQHARGIDADARVVQ